MNKFPRETFDVLLPAGGRINDAWAKNAGAEIKTLLKFGGETMLQRTIRILRETANIGRIVVIGPAELREAAQNADVLLPEGESGPDNIFRGLAWLQENPTDRVLDIENDARVLVMTTDLPFVTSSSIAHFLEACSRDAEICIPIVEKAPFEARFPDSPNFWVPLGGQNWTLACAFLLHVESLKRSKSHIEAIFAARKSQLQMAKVLGPLFIARLLLKKLTIAHIQQRCEKVLGCRGQVIDNAAPELAFDIDDEAEYLYATAYDQGALV